MKIDLIKTLKSKYPRIKKVKKENDLIADMILDSLELMGFLILIEKKYNFHTKKYIKENKKFQIKLIEDFIKNNN
tara:strand:- start:892 stop:1116 length:225 start_codon:yes stop_codon:yes gene_type:complete